MKLNVFTSRPAIARFALPCLAAVLFWAPLAGCAGGGDRARSSNGSWFRPKQPKLAGTMSEFLKQPRPDF